MYDNRVKLYELIKTNRDVQSLWEIIEETHKVFTISQIAAISLQGIPIDTSRSIWEYHCY
jgi:hypothetical protein